MHNYVLDQESFDHIHRDSSKKNQRIDNDSNWKLESCISPRVDYLPWLFQFENDLCKAKWKILHEEHLVHQGEQMYEHIAFEVRYEI